MGWGLAWGEGLSAFFKMRRRSGYPYPDNNMHAIKIIIWYIN